MTTHPRKTSCWIDGASAVVTAATVIAVLALAALAVPAAARADATSVEAGAAAYKAQCVGCHGADGSGSTPMGKALKVQDLRKPEIQAKKDADLAASIEKGKGKMPPAKGKLSATQISQVVDYIRTLGKAR
jgi:mono/diheme cytochrome c family protein